MRYIDVDEIRKKLTELILRAVVCVTEDCRRQSTPPNKESGQSAKFALEILKNFEFAKRYNIPACQDTGRRWYFWKSGRTSFARKIYRRRD